MFHFDLCLERNCKWYFVSALPAPVLVVLFVI